MPIIQLTNPTPELNKGKKQRVSAAAMIARAWGPSDSGSRVPSKSKSNTVASAAIASSRAAGGNGTSRASAAATEAEADPGDSHTDAQTELTVHCMLKI